MLWRGREFVSALALRDIPLKIGSRRVASAQRSEHLRDPAATGPATLPESLRTGGYLVHLSHVEKRFFTVEVKRVRLYWSAACLIASAWVG